MLFFVVVVVVVCSLLFFKKYRIARYVDFFDRDFDYNVILLGIKYISYHVQWKITPSLLGLQWTQDCQRSISYNPTTKLFGYLVWPYWPYSLETSRAISPMKVKCNFL